MQAIGPHCPATARIEPVKLLRALIGFVCLTLLVALCIGSGELATRFGVGPPHVEVRALENISGGARTTREQLSSVLAWNSPRPLDRPVMNVVGARLRRGVAKGASLSDADLDDPDNQAAETKACHVEIPDGPEGVLCLDADAQIDGARLRELLAHLDRMQREDRDDTNSALFLKRVLDRLADWYGIKLGDNITQPPRITPPPAPDQPPSPTPGQEARQPAVTPATAVILRFGTGQAGLPPSASHDLAPAIVQTKASDTCTAVVIGYADPIGGANENLLLSYRRAAGVADLLIERGLSSDRVLTLAYGDGRLSHNMASMTPDPSRRAVVVWPVCGSGQSIGRPPGETGSTLPLAPKE